MITKTLTKDLQARLTRETVINIAKTCQNKRVRGKKTTVQSKKLSTCNGKTCAEGEGVPTCNGLAVFVDNLKRRSKTTEEEAGWRAFTTKVCLTHVLDEEGNLLLDTENTDLAVSGAEAGVDEPDPSKNGSGRLTGVALPGPETLPAHETVTWEMLATAMAEKDLDRLSLYARELKAENEVMARRLIDALSGQVAVLEEALKR